MGWIRRLRNTFASAEGDFDEERRFHIAERTDDYRTQSLRGSNLCQIKAWAETSGAAWLPKRRGARRSRGSAL